MNLTNCSNANNTLNNLVLLQKRLSAYKDKSTSLVNTITVLTEDIEVLKQRKALIESAKQYYLKVVDMCYMHSIEEMENFVNYVLAYVFYDESYKIKLDITNRYNKSITFYLIDENRNLEMPLRKGNGKGIKAVVSFILLTYYLIRMKSKYIFLDEAFVNISAGYISRFFDYIKQLCHQHNMCIVLITHDPRFPDFADEVYNVKRGVITKC